MLRASNFSNRFRRWVSTVDTLTNSLCAISLLVRPSAISSSTSFSPAGKHNIGSSFFVSVPAMLPGSGKSFFYHREDRFGQLLPRSILQYITRRPIFHHLLDKGLLVEGAQSNNINGRIFFLDCFTKINATFVSQANIHQDHIRLRSCKKAIQETVLVA